MKSRRLSEGSVMLDLPTRRHSIRPSAYATFGCLLLLALFCVAYWGGREERTNFGQLSIFASDPSASSPNFRSRTNQTEADSRWSSNFDQLTAQIAQLQAQMTQLLIKPMPPPPQPAASPRPRSSTPLMLFMTRPTRDQDYKVEDPKLNKLQEALCPLKCEFTLDRRRLPQADGVFVQPSEIGENTPKRYSPDQAFFLFFREAPGQSYMKQFKWLPDYQINYTIGWFPGADIYSGYNELVPKDVHYFGRPPGLSQAKEDEEWKQVQRQVMNKTKAGYALISHCKTHGKREDYLAELKKRHPTLIDLFGKCYAQNKEKCKPEECEDQNIREYHFYFAFENVVCNGYVTEKFFRMKKLIVPVVLRKADYMGLVPENSYIAVDQFESIDALAKHLQFLMANKQEYLKYFEWTKHFQRSGPNPISRALCKACMKLHEPGRFSQYRRMEEWYSPQRLCDFGFVPRLLARQTRNETTRR
ncbi:Glyco-tran-10-N domain-containing protein [Aphelenchoides fujianensis]|nr:Glyco-tran-10-N domain-containing protein [Aphelenchoides fujianensis]